MIEKIMNKLGYSKPTKIPPDMPCVGCTAYPIDCIKAVVIEVDNQTNTVRDCDQRRP
jgi:hypothetical protein